MADDDRIARALAGVTNVLRMPSRVARSMVEGFDDLVQRAKQESTSAAMGGDYNPQPVMELATGAIGGGTPFAVRGALGAAGGKIVQPPGIRAYHGSPHDFERFDMSKIGTGEGAQAYGHGLYFAENPGTAQSYRDALAPGFHRTLNGTPFTELPEHHRTVAQWMASTGAKPAEIAAIAEQRATDALKNADPSDLGRMVAEIAADRHKGIVSAAKEIAQTPAEIGSKSKGKMYEVNIRAEPQQFLDWDKPLSAQPAQLQQKLQEQWLAHPSLNTDLMDWHNTLRSWEPSKSVAQAAEAGIPGIRYLDQGSRAKPDIGSIQRVGDQFVAFDKYGAEMQRFNTLEEAKAFRDPTQTSNYVLFRDDIIDILRKYGIAVPPTGAALANQERVAGALAQEPPQ